jgi:hypothetical protein
MEMMRENHKSDKRTNDAYPNRASLQWARETSTSRDFIEWRQTGLDYSYCNKIAGLMKLTTKAAYPTLLEAFRFVLMWLVQGVALADWRRTSDSQGGRATVMPGIE